MLKFLERFKRKPRFHWEPQGEPNNYRVRDNQRNRWFMLVLLLNSTVQRCIVAMVTRHKDDVHVNNVPTNLEYGTNKQNSEDMCQHGTQCKGEDQHLSKLAEQDVLNIRASNKTQTDLAIEYGVSQGNISQILSRTTWKHI